MTESQPYSTREAQAMAEVGHTTIRPAMAWLLTFIFLFTIGVVPITQQVADIRASLAGRRASILPQCYDIFRRVPGVIPALTQKGQSLFARIVEANRALLRVMHAYEDTLEDESVIGQRVRVPTQYVLARWLGAGNDKTYCGEVPWLYYRPDIEYLTGIGFLEPKRLTARIVSAAEWRSPPQPDPIKAILHFRDQLARRGIQLIVMPTPVKPMIHPEPFVYAYADWPVPLQNPSYERLVSELKRAGVLVFDIAQELVTAKRRTGLPQYLATDTHWRPDAVEQTARRLNTFIAKRIHLPPMSEVPFKSQPVKVSHRGDIALMLKLPERQSAYPTETVTLRQILGPNNDVWRPPLSADVLVLGDSFCNIYSQDMLGWGESAGLIEQLSFELRRPLDRIVVNDNGAYATRAQLGRELARGRDRLSGKRLVIYQFVVRELSDGDWKLVDITLGQPAESLFIVPPAGADWLVHGIVKEMSPVPRPGTVPYKDHLLSLHLVDIECQQANVTNGQAVVYMWSMRDNVWTPSARFRPGDAVEIRLRPWSDVSSGYEGINRSEPEDPALQLQEPCWGEEATHIGQ